jgi:transposase-like protein
MSRKRKQHSAQFNAKVALTALQDEETIAHLSSRSDVHPTMISAWRRLLIDYVVEIFDKNHKSRQQIEGQLDELYRQIGQLKVDNDFLARKLGS